jgi:uncharacterized membrane protein
MSWGMGLGLLFTVLFWGVLIALAAWLIRVLFPSAGQPPVPPTEHGLRADDILDKRLARGEISPAEYGVMKETLSRQGGTTTAETGGIGNR